MLKNAKYFMSTRKRYPLDAGLMREAHAITVSKGFWDEPRPFLELLNLIRGEICEALECHRDGKISVPTETRTLVVSAIGSPHYAELYKQHVKGTLEEELADVLLRCYDLSASDESLLELVMSCNKPHTPSNDFHTELDRAFRWSSYASNPSQRIRPLLRRAVGIHGIMTAMFNLAEMFNINIEVAVQMKMEYNKTRPHKHGRLY